MYPGPFAGMAVPLPDAITTFVDAGATESAPLVLTEACLPLTASVMNEFVPDTANAPTGSITITAIATMITVNWAPLNGPQPLRRGPTAGGHPVRRFNRV